MNTHDIDRLIDKIEAAAPMDIAGRSKYIHDLRAAIEALRSQDREDAELAELLREAAQIIAALPPEHAPKNIRWPIVDELEGFAFKTHHALRIEREVA